LALNFWKTYPSRIKRILTIVAFFLFAIIITVAGALTPLSREEANSISQELEKLRQDISIQFIFGNNFMVCLLMFVPIAGPLFGFYAMYNTGVLIAADSVTHGVHPLLGFLSLFILPVIWLEFFAYSVAMAESVWLTWRIIKRRFKSELVKTCVFISICAVTLLVAAVVEIALLAMLPQG
jgi:hypothetical protein